MSTHTATSQPALPELAAVPWRRRVDDAALRRRQQLWTATTVAHAVPFAVTAVVLVLIEPLAAPVSAIALAKAYIIPALYARRGANVVTPPSERTQRAVASSRRTGGDGAVGSGTAAAELRALGLLGDLLDHAPRALLARTGLVLERGRLGVWLIGEAGALLVRPGGRSVLCWCVRVPDPELPAGDRLAHLLLALRADEEAFATVANLAFSGAPWRLHRKLPRPAREALDAAVAAARGR